MLYVRDVLASVLQLSWHGLINEAIFGTNKEKIEFIGKFEKMTWQLLALIGYSSRIQLIIILQYLSYIIFFLWRHSISDRRLHNVTITSIKCCHYLWIILKIMRSHSNAKFL